MLQRFVRSTVKHRSAAVFDRRSAVIVKLFVIVRFDVAAREQRFHVLQKLRVDRHHVFEMAVRRTILDHPNLPVTLDDLRLDLADILINKRSHLAVAAEDLLTRFDNTIWAQTVRLPRKPKRRLRFLPRLQKRLVRPFRRKRRIWLKLIHRLNSIERALRDIRQSLFEMFYCPHKIVFPIKKLYSVLLLML